MRSIKFMSDDNFIRYRLSFTMQFNTTIIFTMFVAWYFLI